MTTPSHRQLVVHAEIKNNKGQVSQRFVDYPVFKLWQRLMIHQQGFSVVSENPVFGFQQRRVGATASFSLTPDSNKMSATFLSNATTKHLALPKQN
ncbi:MAG: hypothetical protein ACI9ON_000053 [Limisphaerales bacterium]|jgi:hypothetical protein